MKSKNIEAIILLIMVSSASTAAILITPALPSIQDYFGVGDLYISCTISLFLFFYTFGQLFYGFLSNKIGRVTSLKLGLTLNLIGVGICFLSLMSNQIYYLIFGRAISAIGASAGLVCSITLINENFSAKKAKLLLSYVIISFTIGVYLSSYISGVSISYYGWTACLYLLLIHGFILLILSFFLRTMNNFVDREKARITIREKLYNFKNNFFNRKLISFSMILSMATLISYLYAAEAPLITIDSRMYNLNSQLYGTWNLLNAIGSIGGAIVCYSLIKQGIKSHKIIFSGILVTLFCVCLLYFNSILVYQKVLFFFLITTLLFFASSLIYPNASYEASNSIECKATASSIMNFINMFTTSMFLIIVSLLDSTSMFKLIVGLFIYSMIALILLLRECLNER